MITQMVESTEQEQRQRSISDVRDFLAWLESHPEIPLPYEFGAGGRIGIYAWNTKDEARIMARAMGTFEKKADENFLELKKKFGSLIVAAVFSRNQVCKRVVVGTKEIPEEVVPEKVTPAHTVEIVEWQCPSLLDSVEEESEAA